MKKILIFILLINSIIFAEGIKLSPTTITSTTGFNTPLVEENKNITLITKEDISKKQYDNVENILRDTPNIVITNTQFGPTINLRGSGERSMSRVKVLVDGISLTPLEEAMGTLPINSIPVSSIEKIEVIPGGGATLYGSGTTGGVVNIITIADTRKDFFNLNTKSGSYSNRDIDISLGQNLTDKLYLSLTSQYTNKNGYRDNEELESKSFNSTLDYIINDRNRIKFQGLYFTDDGKTSTEVKKSILAIDRKTPGENIDFDSERKSFSIDYEFKANDNWTLYANLFQTEYERNFLQDDTRDFELSLPLPVPLETIPNLKSILNGKFIENSKGIKLKSKYEYENGTLIGGYDYITTNLKRDSLVTTDKIPLKNFPVPDKFKNFNGVIAIKNNLVVDKDTHALYLLNNYNLTEKMTLASGLRYEYSKYTGNRNSTMNLEIVEIGSTINKESLAPTIDKSTDNFAGEIGLNYRFSDIGSVYTRYERGFISPLPSQLTNKIEIDGVKTYTDSNLKSETIDSIEFGLKNMVGNSFITTSIFLSQTDDEITTLDKNANNPALKEWRFENIGQTRRIGTEIFVQQYLDRLTLTESITYIDAEITKVNSNEWLKKGDKVPMVSDWKISFGADYALTDKFSLGGTYIYNSGYEKRELESYDKIKTSSFGVTDIYGNYKIKDYLSVRV